MVAAEQPEVVDGGVADEGVVDEGVVGNIAEVEADNGRVRNKDGTIDVVAFRIRRVHKVELREVESWKIIET